MNIIYSIKKVLPKRILVLRNQIKFLILYLYEFFCYYHFNIKSFKNEYINNKNQLKKIKFVSSRAFFNIFCDRYFQEESLKVCSPKRNIYYIPSDALEIFINKILPKVEKKFTLVVGNSDRSINLKIRNINYLLNNKYLIHVYCQNLEFKHKKVSYLPIGMDFHSRFSLNRRGDGKILPKKFEKIFIKILKSKSKKSNRIYCNFHFRLNKARKNCFEKIPKKLCKFQNIKISQENTWKEIKKYNFIACPDGNGYDTHRFWEAVILGSIPIVLKKHKLIDLYKNFPILAINRWEDINEKLLKTTYSNIKKTKYNYNLLLLKYWINLISKNKSRKLKKISYSDFIKLI